MPDPLARTRRAILNARTEALAQAAPKPRPHPQLHALALRVAGERYDLLPDGIQSVQSIRRLTPLPWAPPEVAGVLLEEGVGCPVLQLSAILDLPLHALPEHAQVLLLGIHRPEAAIVVDQVLGTRMLNTGALAPAPRSLGPTARALVRGVDPEGVPVLSATDLLASPRLTVEITFPGGAMAGAGEAS